MTPARLLARLTFFAALALTSTVRGSTVRVGLGADLARAAHGLMGDVRVEGLVYLLSPALFGVVMIVFSRLGDILEGRRRARFADERRRRMLPALRPGQGRSLSSADDLVGSSRPLREPISSRR